MANEIDLSAFDEPVKNDLDLSAFDEPVKKKEPTTSTGGEGLEPGWLGRGMLEKTSSEEAAPTEKVSPFAIEVKKPKTEKSVDGFTIPSADILDNAALVEQREKISKGADVIKRSLENKDITSNLKDISDVLEQQSSQIANFDNEILAKPELAEQLSQERNKVAENYNQLIGQYQELEKKKKDNEAVLDKFVVGKKETNLPNDLLTSLKSATYSLGSGIAQLPAFLNDINHMMDPEWMKKVNRARAEGTAFDYHNTVADWFAKKAEDQKLDYTQNYEGSILEDLEKGNKADAASKMAVQTVQSLPMMGAIVAASAFGGPAGLLAMGSISAAQQKGELEDNKDMSEHEKMVNALGYGAFEVIGEGLPTQTIAKYGLKILKGAGKEAAEEAVKKTFLDYAKKTVAKFYPVTAPLGEALGEMATQFGQNFTAKYTGEDPNRNLSAGVVDAGLVGWGMGATLSAPGTIVMAARKLKGSPKQPENVFDNPNVSPETKKVFANKFLEENEKNNEALAQDMDAIQNMPEAEVKKMEVTAQKILDNEKAISDPALPENAKKSLQEENDNLQKELDTVIETAKTAPKIEKGTVDVKGAAKLNKPSAEQQLSDIQKGNVVTFEYKNENEVPEVFKEKISSKGEINGKPYVKVTIAKSLVDYHLQEQGIKEKAKAEEIATPKTAAVEKQPSVKPEELKVNVAATGPRGFGDVSAEDASIKDIDEGAFMRLTNTSNDDAARVNGFNVRDGVLRVRVGGAKEYSGNRTGGATHVSLKVPEGFDPKLFAEKLADISHEGGRTTETAVQKVVEDIKNAVSESSLMEKEIATPKAKEEPMPQPAATEPAVGKTELEKDLEELRAELGIEPAGGAKPAAEAPAMEAPAVEEKVFTFDKDGNVVEAKVVSKGKNTSSVIIDDKQTVRTNAELFTNKEEAEKRLKETAEPQEITINTDEGKITGEKLIIPGHEDIDFVIHRTKDMGTVYDQASGRTAVNFKPTDSNEVVAQKLANWLNKNNLNAEKIYRNYRTSFPGKDVKGIFIRNESPAYDKYVAEREKKYTAAKGEVFDVYNDEEKAKIDEKIKEAKAAGVSEDKMQFAEFSKNRKAPKSEEKNPVENVINRLDEFIKEKKINDLKEAGKVLPDDLRVQYKPVSLFDQMQSFYKENILPKYNKIKESARKLADETNNYKIAVINKYGYVPEKAKKEVELPNDINPVVTHDPYFPLLWMVQAIGSKKNIEKLPERLKANEDLIKGLHQKWKEFAIKEGLADKDGKILDQYKPEKAKEKAAVSEKKKTEYSATNLPKPVGDFEVVDVLPYTKVEQNVFKPNQQLKFNQGTYEPVRIVADPDLIDLITIGAREHAKWSGKEKPIDQVRKAELEKKFGVRAITAHTKAKNLARDNRQTDMEVFVLLGEKPVEAPEAVMPEAVMPEAVTPEAVTPEAAMPEKGMPKISAKTPLADADYQKALDLFSKMRQYKDEFQETNKGELLWKAEKYAAKKMVENEGVSQELADYLSNETIAPGYLESIDKFKKHEESYYFARNIKEGRLDPEGNGAEIVKALTENLKTKAEKAKAIQDKLDELGIKVGTVYGPETYFEGNERAQERINKALGNDMDMPEAAKEKRTEEPKKEYNQSAADFKVGDIITNQDRQTYKVIKISDQYTTLENLSEFTKTRLNEKHEFANVYKGFRKSDISEAEAIDQRNKKIAEEYEEYDENLPQRIETLVKGKKIVESLTDKFKSQKDKVKALAKKLTEINYADVETKPDEFYSEVAQKYFNNYPEIINTVNKVLGEEVTPKETAPKKTEVEGVAKIYDRPSMESPVYRVVVNGRERFIQKITGNEVASTGWIEVEKDKSGEWQDVEKRKFLTYYPKAYTKAEIIEGFKAEKPGLPVPESLSKLIDDLFVELQEKSTKAKTEVKEGDTVEIPSQMTGGMPRQMVYKDGEWKQKIGRDFTDVGKSVQEEAQAKFDEKAKPTVEEGLKAIDNAKESTKKFLKDNKIISDGKTKKMGFVDPEKVIDKAFDLAKVAYKASFNVNEAIKKAVEHIKSSTWYKSLTSEEKAMAEEAVAKQITDFSKTTKRELEPEQESKLKAFVDRKIAEGKDLPYVRRILEEFGLGEEKVDEIMGGAKVEERARLKSIKDTKETLEEQYKKENPHSGGSLSGNSKAFDELPENSEIYVYTATTPENAKAILEGNKKYVPQLQGQGIKGKTNAIYVASDPRVVSGLGKTIIGFKVKKSDLDLSPEAKKANQTLGQSIITSGTGAILKGDPSLKFIVETQERINTSAKSGSEALFEVYKKVKTDGSNPELVKAVEDLLGKPEKVEPAEITPQKETIDKFSELTNFDKELESASTPAKRKQIEDRRQQWLNDNPSIKEIDANAKEIIKQLEDQGLITKKEGPCF